MEYSLGIVLIHGNRSNERGKPNQTLTKMPRSAQNWSSRLSDQAISTLSAMASLSNRQDACDRPE